MTLSEDDTLIDLPINDFASTFFATGTCNISVEFGAGTHIGHRREQNEDHFAIFEHHRATNAIRTSLPPESLAHDSVSTHSMVVVDGMGGMNSGERASRLALQTMIELSAQATSWVMRLTDPDRQQLRQRVDAYVQRIHATIKAHGDADIAHQHMGTTWTSAHLLGNRAVLVHLGDSRAYLHREGSLTQLTRDDTMARALIESGMDPESVSKFNHVLLNGLGGGNESASASLHDVPLLDADRLLLSSDGLTDMVSDADIATILNAQAEPQAATDALIQAALDNGGKDNITVVVAAIRIPNIESST